MQLTRDKSSRSFKILLRPLLHNYGKAKYSTKDRESSMVTVKSRKSAPLNDSVPSSSHGSRGSHFKELGKSSFCSTFKRFLRFLIVILVCIQKESLGRVVRACKVGATQRGAPAGSASYTFSIPPRFFCIPPTF